MSMLLPCEEVRQAIPLLLDDELDAEYTLEVEEHLSACGDCREMLEHEGNLRLLLRRAADSISAPIALRRRLRDTLERESKPYGAWLRGAPAVAAAAILAAFIWRGAGDGLTNDLDEVTQRHRVDVPMDVVAADIAPVQKYFRARLPFSVELPRPALESNSTQMMLGGRVIRLQDRDTAYVRYETPRGRVSIFVQDNPGTYNASEVAPGYRLGNRRVSLHRVRGYTTMRWVSRGLVYSVVSELPEHDLEMLIRGVH